MFHTQKRLTQTVHGFVISKHSSRFHPQFSRVYLQASAPTALPRWHFTSVTTPGESVADIKEEAFQCCGDHLSDIRANSSAQKICLQVRHADKCAHSDTGGRMNSPAHIDGFPSPPSVSSWNLKGSTVAADCATVGCSNEQHRRCLGCLLVGSAPVSTRRLPVSLRLRMLSVLSSYNNAADLMTPSQMTGETSVFYLWLSSWRTS